MMQSGSRLWQGCLQLLALARRSRPGVTQWELRNGLPASLIQTGTSSAWGMTLRTTILCGAYSFQYSHTFQL